MTWLTLVGRPASVCLTVFLAAAATGCGGRSGVRGGTVAGADGGGTVDRAVKPADKGHGGADKAPPTLDGAACNCPSPMVYLRGDCVPTIRLGTCAPTCTAGSCNKAEVCDQWAAAPSCKAAAARPACVPGPAMGFDGAALRIHPTKGTAGSKLELTVRGGTFYVGALHWQVTVGGTAATVVQGGGNSCTLKATLPKGVPPGLHAVLVSYGSHPENLAGFFLATSGASTQEKTQPGYPCTQNSQCAQPVKPWSCTCATGRCACNRAAP